MKGVRSEVRDILMDRAFRAVTRRVNQSGVDRVRFRMYLMDEGLRSYFVSEPIRLQIRRPK